MIDDHYDKDIMSLNRERVSAERAKTIAAKFNSIRDSLYLKGGADQFKTGAAPVMEVVVESDGKSSDN